MVIGKSDTGGVMMGRAFENTNSRNEFRKEMLGLLRNGMADEAHAGVREKLTQLGDQSRRVVALALAKQPQHIVIEGWSKLAGRLAQFAARGRAITALGIDFSSPVHLGGTPDASGNLEPHIETNYYSDEGSGTPFSTGNRATLLESYSPYGSKWQGCFEDIDELISVKGMSDLYGAVNQHPTRDSDDEAGDAYVLAACTAAILLHIAVRETIRDRGLPRPMAVLVGSNEDYPFFDAPVVTREECQTAPDRPA